MSPLPNEQAEERKKMVELQIAARGVKNQSVLDSMLAVPRHHFVPEELQLYAYEDRPLPIGEGQTISQPYIVAFMVAALEPASGDKILEIGTGSGYAAAILSRIVTMVYTIERHEILAGEAISRFRDLEYGNISVRVGDGTSGWAGEAPFDGILVSAGAPSAPETLLKQLKTGGSLVIPVGELGRQELQRITRQKDGDYTREDIGLVQFVPLIGKEGWDESE